MAQNNPITNKFFILNTRPKFNFLSYFRLLSNPDSHKVEFGLSNYC